MNLEDYEWFETVSILGGTVENIINLETVAVITGMPSSRLATVKPERIVLLYGYVQNETGTDYEDQWFIVGDANQSPGKFTGPNPHNAWVPLLAKISKDYRITVILSDAANVGRVYLTFGVLKKTTLEREEKQKVGFECSD